MLRIEIEIKDAECPACAAQDWNAYRKMGNTKGRAAVGQSRSGHLSGANKNIFSENGKLRKLIDELLQEKTADGDLFALRLKNALGARGTRFGSAYMTAVTPNGMKVSLRISRHNAHAVNYARRGTDEDISIVLKSIRAKDTFFAYEDIRLTEYVYDIRDSDSRCYAMIAKGILRLLETGEYEDLAGADRINTSPAESLCGVSERDEAEVMRLTDRLRAANEFLSGTGGRPKSASQLTPGDYAVEYLRLNYPDTPDGALDTPAAARQRGFVKVDGEPILRQRPLDPSDVSVICRSAVHFSETASAPCSYALIPPSALQPSHREGRRNWAHFIPEAQPKDRTDGVSSATAEQHARNIIPELLTDNYYAFSGAPVVNARGEVIQGNGRADALRIMFDRYPESVSRYADFVAGFAKSHGKAADGAPRVLVRIVDVDDNEAIKFGRFTDTQITTGGDNAFIGANVSQQLMCDNRLEEFSQIIFEGGDEDSTLTQLIRENGEDGVKWLRNKGYITAAEASACLTKEDVIGTRGMTSKGVAAIYETFTSALLRNAPYDFERMFETLPARVQAGILQAITRDFSMPDDKKLMPDIREAVEVYYLLVKKEPGFKEARTMKQARQEIWMWENQGCMFSANKFPADKYSYSAKMLAALFKVSGQAQVRATLNEIYDRMTGSGTPSIFANDEFGTAFSKEEAIRRVLDNGLGGTGAEPAQYDGELSKWPRRHTCPADKTEEQVTDIYYRLVMPLSRLREGLGVSEVGWAADNEIMAFLAATAPTDGDTPRDRAIQRIKVAMVEKEKLKLRQRK